jgi:hypothetical protein
MLPDAGLLERNAVARAVVAAAIGRDWPGRAPVGGKSDGRRGGLRAAAEGVREALGGQRPPERQRASRSSGRGASGGGAGAAGNRVSGPESKS